VNGSAFLLGVLLGSAARRRADERADEAAWRTQNALEARLREEEIRRLEEAANAQPVAPIRAPLSVTSSVVAKGGSFTFGVPQGFGPLPSPQLEHWIATTGPSLATATDLTAEGVPIVLSVNDSGAVEQGLEDGLWRLTCDLRDEVASKVGQAGLSLAHGPQAILVDGARAVCCAFVAEPGDLEQRTWVALTTDRHKVVEITMNVLPQAEDRYLPVWWTALASWQWSDRVTGARHVAPPS